MERVPADRAVIERFVQLLGEYRRPGLTIAKWPEVENPGHSEIDAIAGDLAIEHTSVDTVPGQRMLGDHFEKALAALELLPVSARLSVCVPYEPVVVGTDWNAFRVALTNWILEVAPVLPDGHHEIELPGTAFRCGAYKDRTRQHRVVLSRPAPDDHTLPVRVGHAIRRKLKKLERYKAQGFTTVVLLETKDIALMNQHKMLEAARQGMGGAMLPGLDQIWYVEANGCVAIELTAAIVNGHDRLG